MTTVDGNYWPKSPYFKALVILFAIGPFALLHWIPWYLAALPATTGLASWLGRFLMQLDDDHQPGHATSIRIPRGEAETGRSGGSSGSAGIAPCMGPICK